MLLTQSLWALIQGVEVAINSSNPRGAVHTIQSMPLPEHGCLTGLIKPRGGTENIRLASKTLGIRYLSRGEGATA